MEAIRIKLTGTENYSVEYRTHLQDFGWLEWQRDGEISGAVGENKKMEYGLQLYSIRDIGEKSLRKPLRLQKLTRKEEPTWLKS